MEMLHENKRPVKELPVLGRAMTTGLLLSGPCRSADRSFRQTPWRGFTGPATPSRVLRGPDLLGG